jgi:hypothetical protein
MSRNIRTTLVKLDIVNTGISVSMKPLNEFRQCLYCIKGRFGAYAGSKRTSIELLHLRKSACYNSMTFIRQPHPVRS